jgi:mRNA-degrading endonuclease YafQ of YafQ-DinJ toxin-antitoxin module
MFEVKYTSRFKKDYKRLKKRGYDMNKLLDVVAFFVKEANCRLNIKVIHFMAITRGIEIATSNPIGF